MAVEMSYGGLTERFGRYFFNLRNKFSGIVPSFRLPPHFGLADQWMESLVNIFLGIPEGLAGRELLEAQRKYQIQHTSITLDTVETIREKRTYSFFVDVIGSIEKRFNLPFPLWVEELKDEPKPTLPSFLLTELLLLWVKMEKKGRFLVCVKGEHQRKYLPLPDVSENRIRMALEIGQHILTVLPFVTPEHLDLIPDRFGPVHGVDNTHIRMPIFDQSIEEVIADAKLRQHYIVSPAGACVRWKRGAGDLVEMFVKEIEGVVIAKVLTGRGETLALIDLKTARGIDFVIAKEGSLSAIKTPLALALASVYHDLVTRKEIKIGKESRLSIRTIKTWEDASLLTEEPITEEPTVVYIPRKVVIGGKTRRVSPRLLTARKSPIEHLRHLKGDRQMTERQRHLVEDYERKHRVRILEMIKPGCTFVLPRRPRGEIIYIKAAIEADLAPLRAE